MHIFPGVVVHVSSGVIDVEGRVLVGEVQLEGLPRVPVHAHLLVHLHTQTPLHIWSKPWFLKS